MKANYISKHMEFFFVCLLFEIILRRLISQPIYGYLANFADNRVENLAPSVPSKDDSMNDNDVNQVIYSVDEIISHYESLPVIIVLFCVLSIILHYVIVDCAACEHSCTGRTAAGCWRKFTS